jgi:hypothetical protein
VLPQQHRGPGMLRALLVSIGCREAVAGQRALCSRLTMPPGKRMRGAMRRRVQRCACSGGVRARSLGHRQNKGTLLMFVLLRVPDGEASMRR